MDKKKIIIPVVASIVTLVLLTGITYAFFSAKVTENHKTETVIKTNELNLVYTGVTEIAPETTMIPGNSFTKTFTVENKNETKAYYNIYMQNITNGFNEDLVYTLTETTKGEVVAETKLPATNTGKSYLLSGIGIAGKDLHTYTLKIEYKYLDTPQNDYRGAQFKATVGIDANKILAPINYTPKYYAYGDPTTASTIDYTTLGKNVFVGLDEDGSQKSVCIVRNSKLECFKNNNWDVEKDHIQQVFSDVSCNVGSSSVICATSVFLCDVYSGGGVSCYDNSVSSHCVVHSDGAVSCEIGGE